MGIIENINKFFDYWICLGIMFILMVNDDVDFNCLKELFDVIDGNFVSYIKVLENVEYILVEK